MRNPFRRRKWVVATPTVLGGWRVLFEDRVWMNCHRWSLAEYRSQPPMVIMRKSTVATRNQMIEDELYFKSLNRGRHGSA